MAGDNPSHCNKEIYKELKIGQITYTKNNNSPGNKNIQGVSLC